MELSLTTLIIIVAMVAVGAVVTRARTSQEPGHALGPVLAARLVVILVVTALVVAARVAVGPLAAAVTGVVGVLIAIVLLILTGYARSPRSHAPAARDVILPVAWTKTGPARPDGQCLRRPAQLILRLDEPLVALGRPTLGLGLVPNQAGCGGMTRRGVVL